MQYFRSFLLRKSRISALPIRPRLSCEVLSLWQVKLLVQDRVSCGILVYICSSMSDPLPRHENRKLYVKLDLGHLKWRGMAVTHQIRNQSPIFLDSLRSTSV